MKSREVLLTSSAGEAAGRELPAASEVGPGAGRATGWWRVGESHARTVRASLLLSVLATQMLVASTAVAQTTGVDPEVVSRLEALILEQQRQMSEQQRMMQEQQRQLESLRRQVGELKATTTESLTEAQGARRIAESARASVQAPGSEPAAEAEIVHSEERAKLVLKGWVNRAVNIVDDGKDTDAYFVDNDNAESRLIVLGTLDATDDVTLGTNIELTIAPNKASNVNQREQETNNIFDQRKVEGYVDSKRFGRLTLGKGDTASYHTSALDISGTMVIATSTISDTAGGMFFREKDSGNLTDLRILQSYNMWDGLNRRNRLRYDSPNLHGFKLSGSLVSDSRYDVALRWGGKGNGFRVLAGGAIAEPNVSGDGLNYNGSVALLHEDTGLNVAFAAGMRERDNQDNPYNLFGKIGWRSKFLSVGETAFSFDYTRSMDFPSAGDEGYSYAVAAVQQFEKYGTEAYVLYRLHSLDRAVEPEVDDLDVVSIGARVRF